MDKLFTTNVDDTEVYNNIEKDVERVRDVPPVADMMIAGISKGNTTKSPSRR